MKNNRVGLKKYVFLVIAAILVVGSAFASQAKTKAVTYFGDEWPVNFLNCEHADAEADFEQIKTDGFNTVIYCIPWREVQPNLQGDFDEVSVEKINRMMTRAEACGLKVMFRLGYTWDYAANSSVTVRFRDVFTDRQVRNAWLCYAKKMYEVASAHRNFAGAFLTWEDFWDSLSKAADNYEEMDQMLIKLLADTQAVFPDLSMECRLHSDLYKGGWYPHDATFGCANASYSSAMLAVSMGWADDTLISTSDAVAKSAAMIDRMTAAGKPVFIDQFLYMETTPGFEHLAQAADTNAYLAGMGKIFSEKTNGYGIWTYRDYVNNAVYNPEFGLADKGWILSNASVANVSGNNKVRLNPGGTVKQSFVGSGWPDSDTTKVRMLVDSDGEGVINVSVGSSRQTAKIHPGEQLIELSCPGRSQYSISISSSVAAYIDNVKVYTTVTGGNIYDLNNVPGPYLSGIRALNANLK